jgi:hypothetical protein
VSVGLPEALERAASSLPAELAEGIRPANGDPAQLLELLDAKAAARVLAWLLTHEAEAGAELAAEWAELESAAGPLLALDSEIDLPKTGKKALRRALHRLRSRGVVLPEAPRADVVATLPPLEDDLSAAMISAIDPRGTRVAYVVEANPAGGARLFEVMLDEERGVVGLEVYTTGRSKVRRFLREFTTRDRFPAVEAPEEAVCALVDRVARAQPADRPLPRGFSEWRSRLTLSDENVATPGELARQALEPEGEAPNEREALAHVAERVRAHELGPWPIRTDRLAAVAEKLGEIGSSRLIVSGAQRGGQVDLILGEALEEIFDESAAALTAQRFEESAFVSWKCGAEADARSCLAAARAFREPKQSENPVARAMIEVWLEPTLRKLAEESKDENDAPLLVKPGDGGQNRGKEGR